MPPEIESNGLTYARGTEPAERRIQMDRTSFTFMIRSTWLILFLTLVLGCDGSKKATISSSEPQQAKKAAPLTITLGAYTTPREAYGKSILPAFRDKWRKETGAEVTFNESYLGSGAQARAIVGGFEADVAALSLDPDVQKLTDAGLIKHEWKSGAHKGIVTRSIVVIGVREGNPKNIRSWEDLAKPGIEVLTPNVRTSGGAMWNILAIYGAALRGQAGTPKGDQEAAINLVGSVLRNVKIMDRGGRESLLTFERGVGDVVITYENEILLGKMEGKKYDYVAPPSSISIENPVALVDVYADRHNVRAASKAFVDFLFTPEVQHSFAKYGFRPVDDSVAKDTQAKFAPVSDLFTVSDLGGWAEIQKNIFAQGGVYDRALERSRKDTP